MHYVTGDGTTTPFTVDASSIAIDTSAIVKSNADDWIANFNQGKVHYPAQFSVNENDIDLMVEMYLTELRVMGQALVLVVRLVTL